MTAAPTPRKPALGPRWVLASTLAAAVAIAMGRPLAEVVREPFSPIVGGLPTLAFFGAIFGLCLGLGHTLAERHVIPAIWWTLASTVGGAGGFVLGVKLATLITDPLRGQVIVYVSEVLGYLVFGAAVGVLIGVTQWVTWRARGRAIAGWILGSALGWALGFTVTAGIGLELTAFPSVAVRDVIFGGLAGFIAGSTQALLLARRRSRERLDRA